MKQRDFTLDNVKEKMAEKLYNNPGWNFVSPRNVGSS